MSHSSSSGGTCHNGFLFDFYLTELNSTRTRRQNVPVHSNVRAVFLRHATCGIVRPAFLLIRGRRSRRSSAGNVVQK